MIINKCYCDLCNIEINNDEQLYIIKEFPRIKFTNITGGYCNSVVGQFKKYSLEETHLCKLCFMKIANSCNYIDK